MRIACYASIALSTLTVRGDFTGTNVVSIGEINPNGGTTFQVFAQFSSPDDWLLGVGGVSEHAALVYSGDTLIQNEVVPNTYYGDVPSVVTGIGDSWITIGDPATQNTAFSPGFLGGDGLTSLINGSYFIQEDDGGYFDSNPSSRESGGSILIAQFTVAGNFTYQGTVIYGDVEDGLSQSAFAATTVPAPGVLFFLAITAGVNSRQSRRRPASMC